VKFQRLLLLVSRMSSAERSRWRGFRFDFRPSFLGRLPICNALPTMFDNCLRNRFFNPSWPFSRLGSGNCRSVHFDHSSSDDRAWIFRFHVDRDLALEAQTFNRLLTACPQLVVVRALILQWPYCCK
jgi:hypothetical protein